MIFANPLKGVSSDALEVARAMALHWTWRARSITHELLRHLGARNSSGKAFTQEEVRVAQAELKSAKMLLEYPRQQGYWRLENRTRAAVYRQLLEEGSVTALKEAVLQSEFRYPASWNSREPQLWDMSTAVAYLCLNLYSGAPVATLQQIQQRISRTHDWTAIVHAACLEGFDAELFERITPEWRWNLAFYACGMVCDRWAVEFLPCLDWALGKLDTDLAAMPPHLRWQLAEALLLRGEAARAAELLGKDAAGLAQALRAVLLAQQGRWAESQAGFESALKVLQLEHHRRKNLLPDSVAWFYPLALLAQPTPRHLELARKFCKAEASPQNSQAGSPWRAWVHALSVRLGDEPLEIWMLEIEASSGVSFNEFWRCLLRAWLGVDTVGKVSVPMAAKRQRVVAAQLERLRACGFAWLEQQLIAAEAVFTGGSPPVNFFIQGAQEAWRTVLVSLQNLAGDSPAAGAAPAARILWSITLDRKGGIDSIQPLEQKRGVRGWSKPRALALAKLADSEKLGLWDAKVARAIRRDRYGRRIYNLDRAAAIASLIGHPAVVMSDAPEITVDLVEGVPELEVLRQGERYILRVTPEVRETPLPAQQGYFYLGPEGERELEALRYITLLRDSAQRVRVICLTPAQRRAAQLVSGRFSVPAAAQADLQQTLQVLAAHFQVQSDHASAAREIAPESRLRAELAPVGASLMLRLVVAPLGADGPRLMPGGGRARVMAAVKGETIGTQRDLKLERAGLDEVLAAFDFLEPPERGSVLCEWQIDDPEKALGLVEALPGLPAIHQIDWPRGKPVRVISVGSARLALTVRTEREWFRLQGGARLDEGLVLKLEDLLAAAAGKSRFVPMGEGVYAALTRELREKLAELGAVGESKGDELRVPQIAAAWLDDVLQGVDSDIDPAFAEKVERLRAGQEARPAVPTGLQAELRAYQEDGFLWAMRLAQAGFGACLADDMGLGKTIQTLAVLLARAAGGPALVVAPTSVCGNWLAETLRFAPTLNTAIYGEGERALLVESAGPGDLVIVSYTLMQQAQELFAAKTWHTLVADEAQAVKNAAARRSQALFELPADFRMALSGTPIENRLAELWSIMRFCNPGLLGSASRFNETFAIPIERNRDREAQRMLRRLIGPFVLRRTKSQVLEDLPPRTELVLSIVAESVEAAHYEALRRTAVSEAERAAASGLPGQAHFHILAQLTRLRRAACDPRLVTPELGIVGAKVRAFAELATELAANGHKALVFSQFVGFLTLLRVPLEEAGIKYQYLDGSTPAAERSRRVAAFQGGEGDLFLISLKAGGFGLNLTAADYVVITDPWWNPAAEDQAMGRAHRIGQLRPVTVYRLIAKGTLEERIVELHHEKRALADGLLAEGGEGMAIPSTAELIALMRGG